MSQRHYGVPPFATLRRPETGWPVAQAPSPGPVWWSVFAAARRRGAGIEIASALSPARLVLTGAEGRALHGALLGGLEVNPDDPHAAALVADLLDVRLAVSDPGPVAPTAADECPGPAAWWSPALLEGYAESFADRFPPQEYGGVFPHPGPPSLSDRTQVPSHRLLPLALPDAEVHYGGCADGFGPLDRVGLGCFLGRFARLRPGEDGRAEIRRAYPTPGGLQAVGLLVAAREVDGLDAGLYRYRPREHALVAEYLGVPQPVFEALDRSVAEVCRAAPAALVLTCSWPRLLFKYVAMPYSVALQEAGAILRTAFLAADDEGLVLRPVGGNLGSLLEPYLGVPPSVEGMVGGVLVGGVPS